MNELNLPPHRTLPPEVGERMRARVFAEHRRSRLRVPLAAAAGVAVLAAGAMIVGQSVAGTPDDYRPGTTPATATTTTTTSPGGTMAPIQPLTSEPPDERTTEDLDRCGAVAAASERAREFAPRSAWEPRYTVSRRGHRITAFAEYGGKPGFCDVTATTATVSDPSAETMNLGIADIPNSKPITVDGLYLSEAGLLAGVAQGTPELGLAITHDSERRFSKPMLRDETFVVDVGTLAAGDVVDVWAFDDDGNVLASGRWTFDPAKVRPVGATATDR
jgi:hypothetical protein